MTDSFKMYRFVHSILVASPSQCKELSNGRLAMLAIMGMIAQELVTHQTLF